MELEFLRWLRQRLPQDLRAPLGTSDDAALLQLAGGGQVVMTVDMLTEGVDFLLTSDAPERIGRKALAVNLSDIAAMAARPLAALVALSLPADGALELAKRLIEGMLPLAEKHGVVIAGGDTNTYSGPLVVSITLVGEVTEHGPLVRSGAQAGDAIVVTGTFGGSRLGHQFDFEPRVSEAIWLAEHMPLHAGIDTSDGLSLDLARICEASGVGAELELERIPLSEDAQRWAARLADGSTALDHGLADGEDFELILAIPVAAAEKLIREQPLACGLSIIGRFISESGLWQSTEDGGRKPLVPRGFEH